jgi:Zn-dependent protease
LRDSVRLVRVGGVEVRVQALFLLLPLVAVATGLPEGAPGVLVRLALLGVLVGAVLAHEVGHAVGARARGVRVGHVSLGFLGGVAWIGEPEGRLRVPADTWVPALAGPGASLLVAATLFGLALALGHALPPPEVRAVATDPFAAAIAINLLMGTLNLLPAFPADGGRALHAALSRRFGDRRAVRLVGFVGDALALALLAWALVDPDWPRTGLLLLVALLLGMSSRNEARLALARATPPAE